PGSAVSLPRMSQVRVRLQPRLERAVRIRLTLLTVLFIESALQFHQVAAAVWLRPVPGDSLAAFHHTVVLGSPRRGPRNSYADTYQPQGQRGGQVAPRTPGTSVVHSQRLREPPLSEAVAELVLHHAGGYLNEVAVGKKRESATPLLSIHQRFLAMRSFD